MKVTINSNQLPEFLELARRNGTVDVWCEMALECIRVAGSIMAERAIRVGRLSDDRDALLALAHKYASECSECGGIGSLIVGHHVAVDGTKPCPDCADIRAVIDKAEGRA